MLQALIGERKAALDRAAVEEQLAAGDASMSHCPVAASAPGVLHPVTRTIERMQDFFGAIGFDVVEGPEIEDDYHNFEALNIPAHHPPGPCTTPFYVDEPPVLRTHTSPVQVRSWKARRRRCGSSARAASIAAIPI